MRVLFALLTLIAPGLLLSSAPDKSLTRIADVKDRSGTVTRVSGLHYCFEESEGEEVYINKYDNFFVRRGDAVIQVYFESLNAIIFTDTVEQKEGKGLRKAVFHTASGKQVEADVICHPGCFISGHVDLGDFRLDLERVKEMHFVRDKADAPAGFEIRLYPGAETPGGVLPVMLFMDGTFRIEGKDGSPTVGALKKALSKNNYQAFIRAEAQVPYRSLRSAFKLLQEAGARSILLGP